MTPPKEPAKCPICHVTYSCLGKHLACRHLVKNKEERRILINYGSGRVNFRHLPCPVPGCRFSKTRVDRHLLVGHPEVEDGTIQKIVQDLKKQVTLDALRALRASKPNPPVISDLDIGTDHEELFHDAADVVESSCAQCQGYQTEIDILKKQLRLKQRWVKRARARIAALEQVCTILEDLQRLTRFAAT